MRWASNPALELAGARLVTARASASARVPQELHLMKRPLLLVPLLRASCGNPQRRVAIHQDSASHAPVAWPALTPTEWSTYSQIIGKAMSEPLAPRDVATIRDLFADYATRTGDPITRQGIDVFLSVMKLNYDYNRSLAANLLLAIDTRQPSFSKEFVALRASMARTGMTRATKLAADSALVVSAAYGWQTVDEFGVRHHPTTRETVLEGMHQLEIMNANMSKLAEVLEAAAGR